MGPWPPRSRGGQKKRRGSGGKGGNDDLDDEAEAEAQARLRREREQHQANEAEAEAAVNDAITTAQRTGIYLDGIASMMAMIMATVYCQRKELHQRRLVLTSHNQNPAMIGHPWVYDLRGRMIRSLQRQEALLGEVDVLFLDAKVKCETQDFLIRGPWLRDQSFLPN